MTVIELGGAGPEPVAVAEAKAWCRIDRGDEDDLIGTLITAAREAIERETTLLLVKRNIRLILDAVPSDLRIEVPRRPIGPVTAVTAYSMDGTPTNLAPGSIAPRWGGGTEVLHLAEAAAAAARGGLEVDLEAGYDVAAVPEALKLAIKQIVSASYEVRAAVPADLQPGLVPPAARSLIAPFRRQRL